MTSQPWKNKEILYQKYVTEGLTCQEIAREFSTARTTVLRYLKLNGVKLRKAGSNQRRKRGVSYGEKSTKRKIIEYKREKENIHKMSVLRRQGFSYWKIAEVFNSMSIPTKTKRGKWHAKKIHQILTKTSCK